MLKEKTHEKKKKALRYIHWCKESKDNRKIWTHKHRAAVRDALNSGKEVPQYKASGGTLTW